jgi:4-oxalmesaconate hydratase
MIIDCHGHYTTAPAAHQKFRDQQIARLKDATLPPAKPATIGDDEIRETIEVNQLKLQRERGADLTLFSPRASAMAHHVGDEAVSLAWTRACNDLIKRVVDLYPENFAGVCQLPQSPGVPIANSIAELRRCVAELGFVGCNLNPDPSGGHWTAPPLTDRHWYPFYEAMVELDVPAMIHVSASCNPNFHATGAHYINADTTAFMQFIEGNLFADFLAALHYPAWRRRRAVSLGTVPRARGHAEAAAARRARDAQRLLRHLCLSPAWHRPARRCDRSRQHPVWLGDGRRRTRH